MGCHLCPRQGRPSGRVSPSFQFPPNGSGVHRFGHSEPSPAPTYHRDALRSGLIVGIFLAAGYQFQTAGLARTTAAKSAFITGLVVVFVPLFTLIPALRPANTSPPRWTTAIGAILAFTGLLLLTTPTGTSWQNLFVSISTGDLLTLACAVAFAAHLMSLAHNLSQSFHWPTRDPPDRRRRTNHGHYSSVWRKTSSGPHISSSHCPYDYKSAGHCSSVHNPKLGPATSSAHSHCGSPHPRTGLRLSHFTPCSA